MTASATKTQVENAEYEALTRASAALKRDTSGSQFAFLYYGACLFIFTRVWLWHLTPAAAALPGAQGFGWFFRYLTFCSYTLQTIHFFFASLGEVIKEPKARAKFRYWANCLGCATFPLANTVTLLYYALETSTKGLVEHGDFVRPHWLDFTVHGSNSIAAWGDILISQERSFSPQSRLLALGFAATYSLWAIVVKFGYGKFPYPILNKLPFPHGFACFVAGGVVLVALLFQTGAMVRRAMHSSPYQVTKS